MNPDELHTGEAATADGWRYRMVYLEPQMLEEVTGVRRWWLVAGGSSGSAALAAALSNLFMAYGIQAIRWLSRVCCSTRDRYATARWPITPRLSRKPPTVSERGVRDYLRHCLYARRFP